MYLIADQENLAINMSVFRIKVDSYDKGDLGQDVSAGDLLYLADDGKYYKATARDKSKSTTELKIALKDGETNDTNVKLLSYGVVEYKSSLLTPGDKYYVSENLGEITNQVYDAEEDDHVIRYVGTAISHTKLLFNPDQTYISDNRSKINEVEILGSGDKHFVFEQAIASDQWDISHNLKKYPSVSVVDSAGTAVEGLVEYKDKNRLIIKFNAQFTGTAYIN